MSLELLRTGWRGQDRCGPSPISSLGLANLRRYCLWKAGAGAALLIEGPTVPPLSGNSGCYLNPWQLLLGRWTDSHPAVLPQGKAQSRRLLARSPKQQKQQRSV